MEKVADENPLKELLDELIDSLERMEARSEALHQYLAGEGKAAEKALAPYMEQAANASDVRWRAFRVRAEALLAAGTRELEKNAKPEQSKPEPNEEVEAQQAEPLGKELRNAEGGEKPDGKDKAEALKRWHSRKRQPLNKNRETRMPQTRNQMRRTRGPNQMPKAKSRRGRLRKVRKARLQKTSPRTGLSLTG